MRWLLFFLFGVASVARGQALPSFEKDSRCKSLGLSADEMVCNGTVCMLAGEVALTCEGLQLWADNVELTLREDGAFLGARAVGNVLLVEKNRLITCNSIALGPDRIQTRIEDAVIQIKKGDAKMPVSGVPIGRNRAVLEGDIERTSPNHLRLEEATFTLCDCEPDEPSWRFDASRIEAELSERVTIYGPTFRINAFGLGTMVPILPPLLPISLPLTPRAAGLLPPVLKFYDFPWPQIDIPVFFPLGDSYDVTVTPAYAPTGWPSTA